MITFLKKFKITIIIISILFVIFLSLFDYFLTDRIFTAIEQNNEQEIKNLSKYTPLMITKVKEIRTKDYYYTCSPVSYAILDNKPNIATALIQNRAPLYNLVIKSTQPGLENRKFRGKGANTHLRRISPLHFAVKNEQFDVIQALLGRGIDVNIQDTSGYTPLHYSAFLENPKISELLLSAGASGTLKDFLYHQTPFEIAFIYHNLDTAKILLVKGVDINKTENTPLLHSICGDISLARLNFLLSQHPDLEIKDYEGSTPLHAAVICNNELIAGKLLECGANANASDNQRRTPIFFSSSQKMTALLVSHDAKINIVDTSGETPLHIATGNGKVEMVDFLLKHGAKINIADASGITPLHIATGNGTVEMVDCLLKHGADVNSRDSKKAPPLYYATLYRNKDIVRLLVDNGADISIKNVNNYSPMDAAENRGDKAILDILRHRVKKETKD